MIKIKSHTENLSFSEDARQHLLDAYDLRLTRKMDDTQYDFPYLEAEISHAQYFGELADEERRFPLKFYKLATAQATPYFNLFLWTAI
jgi:hypothetical protein